MALPRHKEHWVYNLTMYPERGHQKYSGNSTKRYHTTLEPKVLHEAECWKATYTYLPIPFP